VQGVAANRARVRADGPRPHRDGVPLFRETGGRSAAEEWARRYVARKKARGISF
jgi:hypothetical protein